MCLGRRHLVVFMTFLGYLICMGSVSVFSVVITHVIEKHDNTSDDTCPVDNGLGLSQPWDESYVFYFQTVYYIGFSLTQVPGGILSAKFSPRRVCGITTMVTSMLLIAVWFCIKWNFYAVFVVRFLQGLAEGPNRPAFNGVISAWALKSERSVMITMAYSGSYGSAALADYFTGAIICPLGWGTALFVYGGAGVVWSVVWLTCIHDSPVVCLSKLSRRERELFMNESHSIHVRTQPPFSSVPWKKMLTSLPLTAICVASFCRNWIFAVLLTQLPKYYKDIYHMEAHEYGLWLSIPHILMACMVIAGGFTVDNAITRRWVSTTFARKAAETIGFGVEACCLLTLGLVPDLGQTGAILLLCVGTGMSGLAISGYQVNPLDLAPQYAAVLTGFVRIGTVGSILSTIVAATLTGVSNTNDANNWKMVFLIAGSLHLAGVLYYLVFASGHQQPWAEYTHIPDLNIQSESPHTNGIKPVTNGTIYKPFPAFGQGGANEKDPLLKVKDRKDLKPESSREEILPRTRSLRTETEAGDNDITSSPLWYSQSL